jgi:hypothetical protein
MGFAGLAGEQGLRNLYNLRYESVGLRPPDITNANCLIVDAGLRENGNKQEKLQLLFVRQFDGPTCRFGLCATDAWIYNEGVVVLSFRARKVGVALTSTNGVRDIVADDFYLFIWNGTKYEPRYF